MLILSRFFVHAFTFATLTVAASLLQAAELPKRIVSTSPSVTGILLAMDAPLLASAAATPSRLTDSKGFFTQWAEVADKRDVQVLYGKLQFDIESVISWDPDLLVLSATGADSVIQHRDELEAQGVKTYVADYSRHSWQEIARQLGEVTGLQSQAQAAIARFDAYAAETAASLKVPEGTVSIVGYNIASSYSIGRLQGPQAHLLSALGFKVVGLPEALEPQVQRSAEVAFISLENLSAGIAGDSVFLLGGSDADVQAFLADPLLANLPAVKNRQVYPLGVTSFRIDYYSGRQMIDTVAQHFR